jgi:tryptophanyl-tRNA synthetase
MGWLNRMTQFKEKTSNLSSLRDEIIFSIISSDIRNQKLNQLELLPDEADEKTVTLDRSKAIILADTITEAVRNALDKNRSNLGLFSYPVLMAADILLYHADLVPVGEDQKQHLELTRDLAGAFNRRYNQEYFKLPEPMIVKDVKRIMSLTDGTKKMSKSDESDLSRINLEDSAEVILKKVKKAKTDSLPTINFDESRPEIYNLLNIFAACSNKSPQDLAKEYETAGNGKFKTDLAESLIEKLRPIQENLVRFKQDQNYIKQVLENGKNQAQEIAAETRDEVFSIVGLK